jgi:hypothetical protein
MNCNDDREWDEIMEDEDNPFDNPDETFSFEESAYKAGHELGFKDIENNTRTNLEGDIDYPSFTTEEIIEQFKQGYRKGLTDAYNKMYEDTDESFDVNTEESCDEDCDEEDVDEENDAEIEEE